MYSDERSILEFNNYHFVLRNLLDSGIMDENILYYSEFPLIREAVRKVTNLLATDFSRLFGEYSRQGAREISVKESPQDQRRIDLGRSIASMEYFTVQADLLTLVTSEGGFARESISSPLLKSLVSHIKKLLALIPPGVASSQSGDPSKPSMFPVAHEEKGDCPQGLLAWPLKCRRCGECCRTLSVVVTPDDMDCIAESLAIARASLEAQYLTPEPFTWSEHNALLKAVSPPGRSEKHIQRCIFLRGQVGNTHSCYIYDARPSACRRYIPNMGLCGGKLGTAY